MAFVFSFVFLARETKAQASLSSNDYCSNFYNEKGEFVGTKMSVFIPGVTHKTPDGFYAVKDLSCYLANLYKYFAGVIGILATVMIIYAGFRYITSFGNASRMSAAKDQIFSAVIAIIITLGTYIFLYTINPRIVTLSLPSVEEIESMKFDVVADWENIYFCRERNYFMNNLCGDVFKVDDKTINISECTGVGDCKTDPPGVCVAFKQGETAKVLCEGGRDQPLAQIKYPDNEIHNFTGDLSIDCGYIYDSKWGCIGEACLAGKRVIGTGCPSEKKGCVVFWDEGVVFFQEGDLSPGNDNIIGAFRKSDCF